MMFNKNSELALWFLVALSIVLSIFGATPFAVGFAGSLSFIGMVARLLFACIHGTQRLGWRKFGMIFAITCIVSWGYESLSIATGFPFGHYVYSAELGPKLGAVPLMIMPDYFGVCYLAWVIAHVLLDKFDRQIDSRSLFAIPVIAAFIMVMWDMSIDPASSTVKHEWIWRDGGGYFGVPFSNFLGWFLCVYTLFQLWAIYLIRTKQLEYCSLDDYKSSWYFPIFLYGSIFIQPIMAAAFVTDCTITDASSQVWQLRALFQSLGLVSLVTMFFVTCLAFFKVQKNVNLK
ncbi:carotenoid biosynthesis protein [Polynucleobacter sp. AP-Latsch-80-C2]|jgi:putative membrane protein|uniref:carotenoid biosynthesis protein n=1 Tax=Polynucleobacter sp. AP-Latsch-80-C2 TaxID=2576931 RepID=UPI001C0C9FE1|nr:carotenoid biosynthesis protein [Polynucleobacter sp. AP-Latsch-80-C2]MBU3624297.1 carotenoid biosynthesis protein [Polynucleobacter sp. AP-Latsch-80-C2]